MIFDLDGVLIDSMPLHIMAWREYVANLGVSCDDIERRMHGRRNSELVRDLLGHDLDDEVVFEHGAAKERLFREMLLKCDVHQYRVPGVIEFLERYPEIPKAVGSNAEQPNIDFVLDRLALRRFFPITVNGHQVSRPKPFPDVYLKAAELLQVQPENCIVFEDSPTGVEAARAARMRIVAVETTPTEFYGVDLRMDDFLNPQLQSWLEAQIGNPVLSAN